MRRKLPAAGFRLSCTPNETDHSFIRIAAWLLQPGHMIITVLIIVVAGILGGIIAGLFGLGGGILFAPVLLFLFQAAGIPDPVLWAVGTSLFCSFAASVSSTLKQYQMGNIYVSEGVVTGLFGIAGTVAGRIIAVSPYYSEREFIIFVSLILMYAVGHFLKKKKPAPAPEQEQVFGIKREMRWYHALVLGVSAGLLATLAGVGGGLILVPGMIVLFSFEFRKAVSISSMSITLITLAGWIQYALIPADTPGLSGFQMGHVDLGMAIPLIGLSFFSARFGVRLLHHVRLRSLEYAFSIILLVVAGRLLSGLF